MTYLKSLFFNFLVVFFANHILPGIEVVTPTRLPHIGGDLMFALGLGLLNSLIYPILRLINRANLGRIALVAAVMTFVSYALLKLVNLGVAVLTLEGYLIASIIVALGSILTNYLELRHALPKAPKPPAEPPIL
jgi:hypothetical protein